MQGGVEGGRKGRMEGGRGGGRKGGVAKDKATFQLSNHRLHGDPSSHGESDLNDTFPPEA